MFLFLYFIACLFGSLATEVERPNYNISNAEEYFEEFIITHGKSYKHNEEKQRRFEIFKENLFYINYLNTFSSSVHGVTQFTDMKKEEFAEQYNSCLVQPEEGFGSSCKVIRDADLSTRAPSTLDYRQKNAVTRVKNQANCKCCWAFSVTGCLEGAYALKYGQLQSFSEQQLMDCLRSSGHCARGSFMTHALSELTTTAGVETDKDYPYVARDLQCRFQPAKAQVKVLSCYNFQLHSEEKLKAALAAYGPIAIGINAEPIQNFVGSVVDAAACPPATPGHAVLLVGYETEGGRDYWIIKNSWGTKWGDQGYVRFVRGQNVCGMMNNDAASGGVA